MPHRSAIPATYPESVAKIELNLPDDLLEHVDDYAYRAGETRNAFLQRIIEEEIDRCHARLRKQLEELLDSHPLDLGGKTAAELVRESRDSR
jgi:predicted DNA-binding protein